MGGIVIQRESRRDVEKDLRKEGAKVGIRRVASDPSKPERPDNVAQIVARRAGRVVDPDDRVTFGVFLSLLVVILMLATTLALAFRIFMYVAGFREAF